MWLVLLIGGVGEIYVLIFRPGEEFDVGDILVVPFLVGLVLAVFEIVFRLTNYIIFHASQVGISTSDWAGRGSRRSVRLPYESIDDIDLDPTSGWLKIIYKPEMWKGRYSHYRQEFKFRPRKPPAVYRELERRIHGPRRAVPGPS